MSAPDDDAVEEDVEAERQSPVGCFPNFAMRVRRGSEKKRSSTTNVTHAPSDKSTRAATNLRRVSRDHARPHRNPRGDRGGGGFRGLDS